jgi:rhodanese-related sulfurtransferase
MKTDTVEIPGPESTMSELLAAYPGAQRALFRRYHIGGCSHCGFRPEETLAAVCARNGNVNPREALDHIRASHEQDAGILIEPKDLARRLKQEPSIRLLDVRSREEYEAVHIAGSALLTQEVMRRILAEGSNTIPLVVIDHRGSQGLDAAAYFLGHGLRDVRCLRGGIDAWAREVDSTVRRYRLESAGAEGD